MEHSYCHHAAQGDTAAANSRNAGCRSGPGL